jgi:type IV secretory pathway VirB4 component
VDRLAIVHRVTSSTVGNFWPFFSASCGTPDGVPFGFAIASREPVLLNPFFRGAGKDTNNMLIVGGPGAGTSFAVFMLILRLLPLGTRFVLINGMNKRFASETFITRILGPELSETIDLGLASAHTLNPFDLDFGDNSGEPSADKMANLLSLFDLMLAPEGQEELDVEEKSLLGGLIRLAYRNANLTGSVPCLSDLAQLTVQAAVNETDPVQRERLGILCRGLLLYTREGPFAGLVDGHTNIDAEKLLIVFDTSALNEPRLQRIAQFMLVEYIERLAVDYKARNVRFAAIIDEISVVMQFRSGARLLADLCARSRKYGMMLVSVTRQWKDFSSHSEQAAAVIKYSNTKLILRQDANDLKDLKEALSLTDAEAVSVEQFAAEEQEKRHCQCLLIVGSVHGTIRLVPSPMDYWICTCEPSKDEPRRAEMIREIKVKNPKLTETDACRQAVYYLGIQHES